MSSLEITDVKVWPLRNTKSAKLKANCRVTFNDSITLNGKLWNGKNGLFVGADGNFGEKKNENGQIEQVYYSAWSINREEQVLQNTVKEAVIKMYDRIISNNNSDEDRNQNQNQTSNQPSNLMSNDVPF